MVKELSTVINNVLAKPMERHMADMEYNRIFSSVVRVSASLPWRKSGQIVDFSRTRDGQWVDIISLVSSSRDPVDCAYNG